METRSSKHNFNLYVLNTILGLQKGSPELFPFSSNFLKMGFDCFSIEREHSISNKGKVKPEIVLCSKKIKNSLLFESTTAEATVKSISKKETSHSQFDRYSSIERDKMVAIAAFPKHSAETYDVVFIVPNYVLQSYEDFFTQNSLGFPVLEFDYSLQNKIYTLEKKKNAFSSPEVETFFSQKIQFKRIPKYIQIDIANPNNSKKKFFELAAMNLLVILYKTKQNEVFNSTDIAKRIVKAQIWKLLSADNKKSAERLVSSFIEQLLNKYPQIKGKYFAKEKKHFHYKVVLPDKLKEFELSKINKRILQFAKDEADPNSNPQLSLEL